MALRTLCSQDTKISGLMLSRLSEGYFHTDEGKEVFGRIQTYFSKKGSPPSYKLLCEDVALSEDSREFLRNADGLAKSTAQAEQLVEQLNKYRQTRLYYTLAKRILKHIEQPKLDTEALSDSVGRLLAKIQLRRAGEAEIVHMGKDSNLQETLEQILYEEDNDHCIPTGFSTFDSVNGGFFRGSLVCIGATSGGGKCCSLETQVQLSTLIFELEDGSTFEAEPEDKLLTRNPAGEYSFKEASQFCEADELVTDPQTLFEQLSLLKNPL